jgi:hypothetical protein
MKIFDPNGTRTPTPQTSSSTDFAVRSYNNNNNNNNNDDDAAVCKVTALVFVLWKFPFRCPAGKAVIKITIFWNIQ